MKALICIVCPKGCHLWVDEENGFTVSGNDCPRGADYGKIELLNPTRAVCSTVRTVGGLHRRCPVKTDRPIPKGLVCAAVRALSGVTLAAPVALGQVVVSDVCGTGANFVATRTLACLKHAQTL